jgi:hypothetical protein
MAIFGTGLCTPGNIRLSRDADFYPGIIACIAPVRFSILDYLRKGTTDITSKDPLL